MARDIPVFVNGKLQGAEDKVPAHGDSGFARLLTDATYYFSERYTDPYESTAAFLENYDISEMRRKKLQYFFCLIISELEMAYSNGFNLYGQPNIVEKAEYLLLDQLGGHILDE